MTAKEALDIATAHNGGQPLIDPTVHDELPPNCSVDRTWKAGECWHILSNQDRRKYVLRSSRLILVRKSDGSVLYDGEANDEG